MAFQNIRMILFSMMSMLLPVGGCCAIVSYILYRSKHPYKHPKAARTAWITVGILFAGGVIGLGVVMLQAMWGFVAKSRITSANGNARLVCAAFETTVEELDERDTLPEHSAELITGQPDEVHEKDSFGYFMDYYCNDHMYYMIVTDGDWHVQYTLWSRSPIQFDAIHPYTHEAQRKYMDPLFKDHSGLVGYYEPPAPTEETT